MGTSGGTVVGAGRSQPLCGPTGADGKYADRSGAGAVADGVPGVWSTAGNADGPRGAVVERAGGERLDGTRGVADAARHRVALQPYPASADPGQSGTLSWRAGDGATQAGAAGGRAAASLAGQ